MYKRTGSMLGLMCLFALNGECIAQSTGRVQTNVRNQTDESSSAIPRYLISLSPDGQKPVDLGTPIFQGPFQCTSDGTIFMNGLVPPRFDRSMLRSYPDSGANIQFDLAQVPNLYGPGESNTQSYDISKDKVVFLAFATTDPSFYLRSRIDPNTGKEYKFKNYTGERSWFLIIFDRTGAFKKTIHLDVPRFIPSKVAVFDQGEFLALGYDIVTHVPELALLSSDANLIRFINPGSELTLDSKLYPSPIQDASKADRSTVEEVETEAGLSGYQMSHYKDNILLIHPGSGSPIFVVNSDGGIRSVPLSPLKGFLLDSLVSSDQDMFVRYRQEGTNIGRGNDAFIDQINEYSGSIMKRFFVNEVSIWDVMCVHDGKVKIMAPSSQGDDQKAVFGVAKVTPYIGAEPAN